jgi:hypothetical protein
MTALTATEPTKPITKSLRETIRLNVDIPKQEYKALKRLALDTDTTVSAVVKEALQQYQAHTKPLKSKQSASPVDALRTAFIAWVDASLPHIHRMSNDEAYHQEVALTNSRLAKV